MVGEDTEGIIVIQQKAAFGPCRKADRQVGGEQFVDDGIHLFGQAVQVCKVIRNVQDIQMSLSVEIMCEQRKVTVR